MRQASNRQANTRLLPRTSAAQESGAFRWERWESFRSLTGKGVAGKVDGRGVALRIPALFSELGIAIGRLAHEADEARREGRTVKFLSLDRKPAGLISVADPIKCANYQIMR